MKFRGPGGIRTRGLFSAIDEQAGEKGKKAVHYVYYVPKSPYNSLRSLLAVIAYLYPNCSHSMKQGKATCNPVQWGRTRFTCMYQTLSRSIIAPSFTLGNILALPSSPIPSTIAIIVPVLLKDE